MSVRQHRWAHQPMAAGGATAQLLTAARPRDTGGQAGGEQLLWHRGGAPHRAERIADIKRRKLAGQGREAAAV